MLILSLVLSAFLLTIANVVARSTGSLAIPCLICGLGALFGFPCALFPALLLTGFLTALSGIPCHLRGGGPPLFLKCSLAIALASHLLVGIVSYRAVRERRILREEYPTESLVQRLSQPKRPSAALPESVKRMSRPAAISLDQLEDQIGSLSSFRNLSLQQLHEDSVADFINSPGFGITRRLEPRREYIDLPKVESITLLPAAAATPPTEAPAGTTPPAASPADAIVMAPGEQTFRELHQESVLDFVNPKGFGLIEDKEHVKGFQVHHFHAIPRLRQAPGQTQRWRIQSLELVSLLQHDEPVAYLSKHLPRMDELRDAPTRPLTPFEKNALASLRKGEELQVESTAENIHVLGSIRALKQCLVCHEGQRGALLGAFSYSLIREPNER
jgi:hypothetical protein